jgi:hypothetical protein
MARENKDYVWALRKQDQSIDHSIIECINNKANNKLAVD